MNGRAFLATARRLAAEMDEADWRSAASRAYYAAFHVGRDRLASLGFRMPLTERGHNGVYVRFNNCGNPGAVRAAGPLFDLRRTRNRADYDIRTAFPATAAAQVIGEAEFVIDSLDALMPAELTAMTAAIKLYEQAIGDVTWQP